MKRSCGEAAVGATADDDGYWAGAGEGQTFPLAALPGLANPSSAHSGNGNRISLGDCRTCAEWVWGSLSSGISECP